MRKFLIVSACVTIGVLTGLASPALADDLPSVTLTIKDHRFAPADLTIPADTKVVIVIKNLDPTPEEFESTDFHREKVVTGGGEIEVYVGPLPAGTYEFFADFHPTTRGRLIVK